MVSPSCPKNDSMDARTRAFSLPQHVCALFIRISVDVVGSSKSFDIQVISTVKFKFKFKFNLSNPLLQMQLHLQSKTPTKPPTYATLYFTSHLHKIGLPSKIFKSIKC